MTSVTRSFGSLAHRFSNSATETCPPLATESPSDSMASAEMSTWPPPADTQTGASDQVLHRPILNPLRLGGLTPSALAVDSTRRCRTEFDVGLLHRAGDSPRLGLLVPV